MMVDYFKYHIDFDFFDGIPLEKIKKVLDMGTGVGFIALALQIMKERIPKFKPKIYASDILPAAINLAKKNERKNNFNNQIHFINSDLFESFPKHLKNSFDVILFNPPYLPSFDFKKSDDKILKKDLSWDGGINGFEVFLKFLNHSKEYLNLNTNSRIYYICSSRTNLKKLYNLIKNKGFNNTILEKRHIFMEDIFLNRLDIMY